MSIDLYPLMFKPVYKDYPWGGHRISDLFNRDLPPGIYAESWEISDHKDGMSIIENGYYKDRSFRSVLTDYFRLIIGKNARHDSFPILIKIIDASEKLSVQVHPDNETATKFGGEPKTEAWHIIGKNESAIYCGLKSGTTKQDFISGIENKTCKNLIRKVPVTHEDTVLIKGGCVHAIDAGCLILEIQQSSNTTYRIYDWDRIDKNGKCRELHIEKAIETIDWNDNPVALTPPTLIYQNKQFEQWLLIKCDFFILDKLILDGFLENEMDGNSFHALFVSEGNINIKWNSDNELYIPHGRSVLIPASLGIYKLTGKGTILRTMLP